MYKRKSNFPKVKLDGRNDLWRFGDGGIAVDKRERGSGRRSRWGAWLLAAALMCALWSGAALAAPAEGASLIAESAAPKPQITIQGNVVVDKGKPTGFYELALCVQTARIVTRLDDPTNTPVSDSIYANALKAAAEGDEDALPNFYQEYKVTNYPFQTASAAMTVNLDALTAVTWGAGTPVYEAWTATGTSTSGTYADHDDDYPRGINTKADGQPDIFTDLSPVENATGGQKVRVRLDTAKPDEVNNATAFIEEMDTTNHTGLLTLSANTTTTRKVVYEVPTPVVVIRFAYDKNRFKNLEVGNPDDLVSEPNTSDFWLGLDRNHPLDGPNVSGKTPLTYLGAQATGAHLYADSDAQVAGSSVFQSVLYTQNLADDGVTQEPTRFYYYLGAETPSREADKREYLVHDEATDTDSTETLNVPTTLGTAILAKRDAKWATAGDPETGTYSFFQNLLTMKENTLRLILVNAETYRKPTGGGGITILFYDWDDSLIGSLIVDGGDVRSQVEEYIEENLVHPDLVPGKVLDRMGGKLPENWAAMAGDVDAQLYQNLTNSLERDYTYRGKYAYTVGDPDDVGEDGDTEKKARANGEDYPLTNKLDYVFTKRVNTSASYSVTDTVGSHTETYVLPHKLTDNDMVDAALYPYTYGWAVVEDTSYKNQNNWKVMYDAVKLEDTWTTIGVGELTDVDPDYYDNGATDQTLPTTLGTAAYQAPAFLADEDPYWVDPVHEAPKPNMNYTKKYAYSLNSNGSESYFRFADFSDIDAELERYHKKNGDTKDTLVVKAVYEPGTALINEYYRIVKSPSYSKYNFKAAEAGAAFKVELTLERSYESSDGVHGVNRIRMPAVQMDTTTDAKWITNGDPKVEHDLDNASTQVSLNRNETTFTRVDTDNGEEITFGLSLSARMNKVDYMLAETFGSNFITGTQRSLTNNNQRALDIANFIPDNYNYYLEGDSEETDDLYDCDFATRAGSHGFVLNCTLGHILEQATLCNEGKIAVATYGTAVQYTIVQNANIRMDINGTQPRVVDATTLQNVFLAAAKSCKKYKDNADYACWDVNLACAKLTYHQAQWFLIDYLADPNAEIRTVEEADAAKLPFCQYHLSCSGGHVPKAPTTWDELIKLVQDVNGTDQEAADNALSDLAIMLPGDIETITSLRRNAAGGRYNDVDQFVAEITAAAQTLTGVSLPLSWPNLQYMLLNPGAAPGQDAMTEAARNQYWWFDGSTTAPALPAVTQAKRDAQWNYLLDAARATYVGSDVRLKDGSTGWTTTTRLAPAETPFNSNQKYSGSANTAWRNLTYNLVYAHEETVNDGGTEDDPTDDVWEYKTTKFPDFEDFKTRFLAAVQALDPDGKRTLTWEEIQEKILKDIDPNDDLGENKPEGEDTKLWWYDANVPFAINNLKTLLEALRRVNETGDLDGRAQAALDRLEVSDLEGKMFQTLRWSKTGQNAADMVAGGVSGWLPNPTAQKNKILQILNSARVAIEAAPNVSENWNAVQYYIVHASQGGTPDFSAVNDETIRLEARYYWWYNEGSGTPVTIPGNNIRGALQALVGATYQIEFNDPAAVASVVAEAQKDMNRSLWTMTRLIKEKHKGTAERPNPEDDYDGPDTLDDVQAVAFPGADASDIMSFFDNYLIPFRDIAKREQGMEGFVTPTFSWYQFQHYIITNIYLDANDPDIINKEDPQGDYWWYAADERDLPEAPTPPKPEPPPNPAAELAGYMAEILNGNMDPAEVADNLTAEQLTAWGLDRYYDGSPMDLEYFLADGGIQDAIYCVANDYAGEGYTADNFSWPQLMLMIISGSEWSLDWRETEEDALSALYNDYGATVESEQDAEDGLIPWEYTQSYPEVFGLAYRLPRMMKASVALALDQHPGQYVMAGYLPECYLKPVIITHH